MGSMGAELFEMSWVQGIVQFFNYLAWTLYVIGLIVACFECGINYAGGKGDIRAVALNAIKGFMAASLFSVVPVRLYQLAISLQAEFTSGMTGYGTSMPLKQNSPVVARERVRQRKMLRQAGAGTAANMHCRIGCTAASAAQGISAAHGATATAASASSGAVSAGWTMATSTATTLLRWTRSLCTEPSLPL